MLKEQDFKEITEKVRSMDKKEINSFIDTQYENIEIAKTEKSSRDKIHVDNFMRQINEKYPDLKMIYAYKDDTHFIYHSDRELGFSNSEFNDFIANLIYDTMYTHDFMNFCISYKADDK